MAAAVDRDLHSVGPALLDPGPQPGRVGLRMVDQPEVACLLDPRRLRVQPHDELGAERVPEHGGGQAEPLTEDAAEIRGWSWLPDGAIVFGRRVDSEARLYRLDVAGLDCWDKVVTILAAMRSEAQAGECRAPGAVFIHRLKRAGLWDLLKNVSPFRVGVAPG